MFQGRIVFVVGAGASAEFNMPLGYTLAKTISENLTSVRSQGVLRDDVVGQVIRQRFWKDQLDLQRHLQAADQIAKGITHARSIDSFIDIHEHNPLIALIGKLQITASLLRAERASTLFVDFDNTRNDVDFTANEKTWLRVFTEILIEKSRTTNLEDFGRNVSIICFNYDRCIEHYLTDALRRTLSIRREEAFDIVARMDIIHPYGSLGLLPRSSFGPEHGSVPFGQDPANVDLWNVSKSIRTFTEQIDDTDVVEEVRSAVHSADRLIFLGFSFQPQNMQLLSPTKEGMPRKKLMTTGYGMYENEKVALINRLQKLVRQPNRDFVTADTFAMWGVKCYEFLDQNRLTLSAE